jgi:hypothetical protein
MTALPLCPDAAALRRYQLGETPWPDAEPLERHLAGCARCFQSLQALRADDALINDLRAGAADAEPDSPELMSLMVRLARLSLAVHDPPTVLTDPPPPNVRPLPQAALDKTEDGLTFLEPPQDPAEVGRLGPYRILGVLGRGAWASSSRPTTRSWAGPSR